MIPGNLVAASYVVQFWLPSEKVSPGVFIAIFLVCIVCINYLEVRSFGEIQFWLSSIKVLTLIGLIFLSLILASRGGPNHHATGFQYWNNPGAFHAYITTGATGRFLAIYSAITTSVFAYMGTELVSFTVGETANPRKAIPRAIKLIFFQIIALYIILVLLLGMTVPYDAKPLLEGASPFMVAIQISGINALPSIFNACVLICVFSAATSDLYVASRILYGLSHEGMVHKILSRTDSRGVPIVALGVCAGCCIPAFLTLKSGIATVFGYVFNVVNIFGLLTWVSILITHICFVRARQAQNIAPSALVYTAPLGIWGSIGALCFSIIITVFNGFPLFCYRATAVPGKKAKFDTITFVTTYLGILLYLILFFGYRFVKKVHSVKPEGADLYSGKEKIDTEEEEFLAREQARMEGMLETKIQRIYRLATGRSS